MIMDVAKVKYGDVNNFLKSHLPKKVDGFGNADYEINFGEGWKGDTGECEEVQTNYGKGDGAVGQVYEEENVFQFRYMYVPMYKKTLDAEGKVIREDSFVLKRLEVIGRILPDGLDIETCRCDVTALNEEGDAIDNTFCADLQIKLAVRMKLLECLGTGKSKGECESLA